MELVEEVYRLTEDFPKEEIYGLTSQMRRCAVSIPSNIAEGKMRGTDNEFHRFLSIAFGSAAELETQILLSQRLPGTRHLESAKTIDLLSEILRMINALTS